MKKLIFLFSIISLSIHSQVVINEYSAANYDDINFSTGFGTNYADWIELYNAGATSVDISGYHLSDRVSNIQKWQIPTGTNIAAGTHLLFLADKKDGFSSGNYHTNFKLTQTSGKETLILSDATGIILDSIGLNYPNKQGDSRCRMTDGSSTWGISKNPTDGSSNNNSKDRYAQTPIFDIPAGFYTVGATLSVTLSTTEPSSSIRYTTDGSSPNSSSTLYVNPISIVSGDVKVVRAKTYSTNNNISSSHIESNTYFVNVTHTTKVISIAGGTALDDLFGGIQNTPKGSFELFEKDGTFLTETTGEYNKHGNDSWAYQQRGVDFVARDQFGKNYTVEDKIFDNKSRDKFQRLILKCGASDNYPFEGVPNTNYLGEYGGAHIRDAFINEMSQLGDLRLDERSNEFAVLYVNGEYWGVYDVREKVDDHDFTNYYYDQDRTNLQYLKTWGGTWSEYGGAQAQTDWDNLVNFITTNDMTIQANYDYVDTVFNTGSLIDYFILNGYTVVADWLNWNTAWWRGMDPAGDKKKWRYTLWDMDASFNHYTNYTGVSNQGANADPCEPEQLGNVGGQGHVPIWNKLQTNDQFFADYINRYAELASTVFSCDSLHGLLTSMTNEIAPEMPAQIAKWGGNMTEWENNIDSIHAFIDTRCVNIASQLVGCNPEISGPYELTILVDPPGAGKVQLSSLTPSVYPYVGTYFGGVDISLEADPNECWAFDHWTIENDTLNPNNTTAQVTFDMSSNDTITIYFVSIPCPKDDSIYINVQPPGSGTIKINSNTVSSFPVNKFLLDSTNHLFDAFPNAGFTFNHWDWNNHTPAPSITSTNTVVYLLSNDTLTVYFDAIVSDTIVYIVQPVGAGTVTVDGTNVTPFPNTKYHLHGTNSTLFATANTGFTFNHWAFQNNTPLPNNSSTNINTNWNLNDTVIVHFDVIPAYDITYQVNNTLGGDIDVNGVNITTFPNTQTYLQGSNVNLIANSNTDYIFDFWQLDNNTLLPNFLAESVSFNVVADDTITANFKEFITDSLWIISSPIGVAELHIGSDIITSSPYLGLYEINEILNIEAIPFGTNTFSSWKLNSLNTIDYNANSFFTFISDDTLYANFNRVLAIENLGSDISDLKVYPTIVNDKLTIELSSNENSVLSISLLNMSGQKIQNLFEGEIYKGKSLNKVYSIKDIANGIYFIKFKSDKTLITHKIVKTN